MLSLSGLLCTPKYVRYSFVSGRDLMTVQALDGKNVKDILTNVGSGGGATAAAPAGGTTGGAAAAEEAPKEEEKKEEGKLILGNLAQLYVLIRCAHRERRVR